MGDAHAARRHHGRHQWAGRFLHGALALLAPVEPEARKVARARARGRGRRAVQAASPRRPGAGRRADGAAGRAGIGDARLGGAPPPMPPAAWAAIGSVVAPGRPRRRPRARDAKPARRRRRHEHAAGEELVQSRCGEHTDLRRRHERRRRRHSLRRGPRAASVGPRAREAWNLLGQPLGAPRRRGTSLVRAYMLTAESPPRADVPRALYHLAF